MAQRFYAVEAVADKNGDRLSGKYARQAAWLLI